MTRVKALELLEDPSYYLYLTMEGLYNLLIRAGYKEEIAHKVALEHGWKRLDAGEAP